MPDVNKKVSSAGMDEDFNHSFGNESKMGFTPLAGAMKPT